MTNPNFLLSTTRLLNRYGFETEDDGVGSYVMEGDISPPPPRFLRPHMLKLSKYGVSTSVVGADSAAPEWVPEGALIHIDLVRAFNEQDAAYVDGTGVVAVDTLLGTDGDLSVFGPTEYNLAGLSSDGYNYEAAVALIGAARTIAGGDFTGVFQFKAGTAWEFTLGNGLGFDSIQLACEALGTNVLGVASPGTYSEVLPSVLNTSEDSLNKLAWTLTDARSEFAVNGSTVSEGVLDGDRPATYNHFGIDVSAADCNVQSITIYATLPDTTGLSELSEP